MDSGALFTLPAFGVHKRLYHTMLPGGLDFLLRKRLGSRVLDRCSILKPTWQTDLQLTKVV